MVRKIKTLSANLAEGGKVPEGYDPTTRPWYKDSEGDVKTVHWGQPMYEIATGKLSVGVSKAITAQDGSVLGVVAMDVSLGTIQKYFIIFNTITVEKCLL